MIELAFILAILSESFLIAITEHLRLHEKSYGKFAKFVNMAWHLLRDFHLVLFAYLGYVFLQLELSIYILPLLWVVHWINADGFFSVFNDRNYFGIATQSGNVWERFGGLFSKVALLIITLTVFLYWR